MLEGILLELPMKDLLLSKAVCKTWKKAIESSVKLQKALFFMPDGELINLLAFEDKRRNREGMLSGYIN